MSSTSTLQYIVLGLLRDGRTSHGYELSAEYRERSGTHLPSGSIYRSLGRLVRDGLIAPPEDPPRRDVRRQEYRITMAGQTHFDAWLEDPAPDGDLGIRLLFVETLPIERRFELIETWRIGLERIAEELVEARLDVARRARPEAAIPHLLPALIERRIRQVMTDVQFLDELSRQLRPNAHVVGLDDHVR